MSPSVERTSNPTQCGGVFSEDVLALRQPQCDMPAKNGWIYTQFWMKCQTDASPSLVMSHSVPFPPTQAAKIINFQRPILERIRTMCDLSSSAQPFFLLVELGMLLGNLPTQYYTPLLYHDATESIGLRQQYTLDSSFVFEHLLWCLTCCSKLRDSIHWWS